MKTRTLPDDFRWSDGRAFTRAESKKIRFVLKRQKKPGESFRQRFERVRAAIERYQSTVAKVQVVKPSLLQRVRDWFTGRPASVRMEVKP